MITLKSYQKIAENNNRPINNQVTYPFLISHEFIEFLEPIWIFSIIFYAFKIFFPKFWKMNVTLQILDMFLY